VSKGPNTNKGYNVYIRMYKHKIVVYLHTYTKERPSNMRASRKSFSCAVEKSKARGSVLCGTTQCTCLCIYVSLRYYVTSRKAAVSIPDEVIGFFN
jgi:hypothetical protein